MINDSVQNILNVSNNSLHNSASTSQGKETLQKSDFMNLFMYQLSNQNPLDPMDSSKMMASLAQLGSMEQLQALNAELKNMSNSQKELVQLNALQYLDRNVHVRDDKLILDQIGASKVNYKLEGNANRVTANIVSHSGEVVKSLNIGSQMSGVYELQWDGSNNIGKKAALGEYTVQMYAYDEKGKTIDVSLTKEEKVSQIKLSGTQPLLRVGDRYISINEALMIDKTK